MGGNLYTVFDTQEGKAIIKDKTSREIEAAIGITPTALYNCLYSGYRYQRRYTFELTGFNDLGFEKKEDAFGLELLKEWDRFRMKLNPRAKRC